MRPYVYVSLPIDGGVGVMSKAEGAVRVDFRYLSGGQLACMIRALHANLCHRYSVSLLH